MEPTRIAVIGCGFYAANHLRSWRDLAHDGARLVAVCDLDATRAKAAGETFGVPHFPDVAAMLAATQPDLVDIVTRAETHRALAEALAPHVRGLIVQKPFAPSLADARAIVDVAAASGAWLAVHENFRFQPPLRRAIDLIRKGCIGRPSWARIRFRTGYDVYATQPYFRDEPQLCVADVGVHLLDLARCLIGEVRHLSAELQRRREDLAGEDTATLLLRHEGGAVSVVDATYESRRLPDHFPETLIEIEGPLGALAVEARGRIELTRDGRMRRSVTRYRYADWMEPRWAMSQAGAFEACRHFLGAFRAGRSAETSGTDNLRTLALVEAAYRAAETDHSEPPEQIFSV